MTDTPSDQPTTATPSDRATLLIAAGSATFAFMLGFNLGAFNAIFFDQLLVVWVISRVSPRGRPGRPLSTVTTSGRKARQ